MASLGRLGELPVESFCLVVQQLPLPDVQTLLQAYPEYQDSILSCLTTPRLEKGSELKAFLRAVPDVTLWWGGEDAMPISSLQELSPLSQRIRGNFIIDWYPRPTREEDLDFLFRFFQVRTSLYPQSLTKFATVFKPPVFLQYAQGSFVLDTSSTIAQNPTLLTLVSGLPMREVEIQIKPLTTVSETYASLLAPKQIETFHIIGTTSSHILNEMLIQQKKRGLPYTVTKVVIERNSSDLSPSFRYPGVRTIQTLVASQEGWREVIPLFPDLQNFVYRAPSYLFPPQEIQAEFPHLTITRIS